MTRQATTTAPVQFALSARETAAALLYRIEAVRAWLVREEKQQKDGTVPPE